MEHEGRITLGSLFDGAGGFPYAGTLAGITPIWASEIEPFPIRVTTKRFPDMRHMGNITEINGARIEPVDIITFGSPCQDLSVAGKRNGLAGERSGLFLEAIRIIREMREKTHGAKPRYIVWENVPGAFSSNKGEDFRTVLEEIANIQGGGVSIPRPDKGKWKPAGEILGDGYSIAWRTYDAQFWGVPQRRKRIYLVADFTGGCAGKIQFESDRLCRDFAQGGREGETTAGTFERDAGASGKPAICLNDQGGARMDVTEGVTAALRAEMHGHTPIVTAFHLTQDPTAYEGKTPCISAGNSRSGQAVIGVAVQRHYEAYQHHGWRESGTAGTLTANQNDHVRGDTPIVVESKVYGLSSKESNAWKSSNPHSGCYEAEATRTLDTRGGDPTCAQGGNIIIQRVYESHDQDSRYKELGDKSETVVAKYGTGGGNTPIVVERKAYTIGRDYVTATEEKAGTLTDSDVPQMVVQPYSIGNGQVHDLSLDKKARTLNCMHDAQAVIVPQEPEPYPYIARRLTPLECCRLQGYPDWWTADIKTTEPTEDEITEWMAVFETHRKATNPKKKPRTRNQIRKWLKDPQTDSAEYKMWGNSLAIPNAYQVLAGIAEQIRAEPVAETQEEKKMPYGQLTIWDFMN